MAKLSENLADLSARAAKVEERAEAFRKESQEARDAKIADLKSDLENAQSRFETTVNSAKDELTSAWSDLNAGMKKRAERVKREIESRKEAIDKTRAERRADRLESNAMASIAYAMMVMDEAEYAVAEALDARMHADGFD